MRGISEEELHERAVLKLYVDVTCQISLAAAWQNSSSSSYSHDRQSVEFRENGPRDTSVKLEREREMALIARGSQALRGVARVRGQRPLLDQLGLGRMQIVEQRKAPASSCQFISASRYAQAGRCKIGLPRHRRLQHWSRLSVDPPPASFPSPKIPDLPVIPYRYTSMLNDAK